jgi:hypothetical protein
LKEKILEAMEDQSDHSKKKKLLKAKLALGRMIEKGFKLDDDI